jgi:hypothetical protein
LCFEGKIIREQLTIEENALIDKYKLAPFGLNRGTHEKCSVSIVSILLKNAKTDIYSSWIGIGG